MNRRQACSGLVRPGGIKPSQTPSGLIISGRNLRMHDGQDVLAQGDPNADSVGSVAFNPFWRPQALPLVGSARSCQHSRSLVIVCNSVRGPRHTFRRSGHWGCDLLGSVPCNHRPHARLPSLAPTLARPLCARRQRHNTGTRPWSVEASKRRSAGPVVLAWPASALDQVQTLI